MSKMLDPIEQYNKMIKLGTEDQFLTWVELQHRDDLNEWLVAFAERYWRIMLK